MENKNNDSSNEKESTSAFKEQISNLRNFWKEKEQTYTNNSGSLGSITSPAMQRKQISASKNDKAPQSDTKSSNSNKDHSNSPAATNPPATSQPINRSQKLEEFKEQLEQQKKVHTSNVNSES